MRKIWIVGLATIILAGCAALPRGESTFTEMEDSDMNENTSAVDTLPGQLLFDFQSGTPSWSSVDDSVMGGVSQSASRVLDEGVLEFSGTMSLENNGGFASIRSPWNPIDLSEYDGILIRVLGDGQVYRLRIRTAATGSEVAYNSLFETQDGEWTTVYIPFETMIPTFRGFRAPVGGLDARAVTSLGLMLSDKQPGAFSLQVDWIRAVSEGEILTRLMPTQEA